MIIKNLRDRDRVHNFENSFVGFSNFSILFFREISLNLNKK